MKRGASAALSIGLSLAVIAAAAFAAFVLYDRFGVGRYRDYFDLFGAGGGRATSLTTATTTLGETESAPLRLAATDEDPVTIAFFGTSMTRQGVLPTLADDLRERHGAELFNLGFQSTRIDRMLDTVRTAHAARTIDVAVVEFGPVFSSDHMLLYYPSNFVNSADRFQPPVFDEEIVKARLAVGTENSFVSAPEDAEKYLRHIRNRWDRARADDDLGANPQDKKRYSRFTKLWNKRYGSGDLTTEPTAWLRTTNVAGVALRRLAAYCRSEGIALIVLAPPRSPDWRDDPENEAPMLRAASDAALATLRFAARRHAFKVLDFDAWSDDRSLYVDEIHLNRAGAQRFSPELFVAIGRFLESGGSDRVYESFGERTDGGS
ncbi:MAG: hypothetical protein AAF108_06810 [Planctomycetota bacterium]